MKHSAQSMGTVTILTFSEVDVNLVTVPLGRALCFKPNYGQLGPKTTRATNIMIESTA